MERQEDDNGHFMEDREDDDDTDSMEDREDDDNGHFMEDREDDDNGHFMEDREDDDDTDSMEDLEVDDAELIEHREDYDVELTIETVALFTEECIFYVLKYYNLHWFPPVDRDSLRRYSMFDLFTPQIGSALAHEFMVTQSREVANLTGFDVEAWLQMPIDEARMYVNRKFLHFTFVQPVVHPFPELLLWSFACYLCCEAFRRNKIFISHVFTQLLNIMYSKYSNLRHYEFLHTRANTFHILHYFLHDILIGDEGYSSTEPEE